MNSIRRVFENDNWLVAHKPAGWLTTPAREKDDPRPCLGRQLQEEVGRQIYPVHRLDFEVAGLVLFAKTAEAHKVGQRWFETGAVIKTYRARTVKGREPAPNEWAEWRTKLLRGKRRAYFSPQGKESVTRARVVDARAEFWLWELQPLTGRPHQLRVELARNGSPILGDELYGGPKGEPNRIELQAVALNFEKVDAADRLGLPATITLD